MTYDILHRAFAAHGAGNVLEMEIVFSVDVALGFVNDPEIAFAKGLNNSELVICGVGRASFVSFLQYGQCARVKFLQMLNHGTHQITMLFRQALVFSGRIPEPHVALESVKFGAIHGCPEISCDIEETGFRQEYS